MSAADQDFWNCPTCGKFKPWCICSGFFNARGLAAFFDEMEPDERKAALRKLREGKA